MGEDKASTIDSIANRIEQINAQIKILFPDYRSSSQRLEETDLLKQLVKVTQTIHAYLKRSGDAFVLGYDGPALLDHLTAFLAEFTDIESGPFRIQNLVTLLGEFCKAKKELMMEVIFDPILIIPQSRAKERGIVYSIFREGSLLPDQIIQIVKKEIGEDDEFDSSKIKVDELSDLTDEHFVERYGQYTYFQELYEIGPMILSVLVPPALEDFAWEARECFALYRHVAVCSLCRTMIEIALKDISVRKNLLRRPEKSPNPFKEYTLETLINRATAGNSSLRKSLHNIRMSTNEVIHGERRILSDCREEHERIRILLRHTMQSIESLYDSHFGLRSRLRKSGTQNEGYDKENN